MDYGAISAWAAIITAFVAIIAVWVQERRARFSQGVDLVLKFDEVFESQEFKAKRRAVAGLILKQENLEKGDTNAIEGLLNHFEMIGLLLRRGLLDKELVSATFFLWLHHYLPALKDYIAAVRRWEPTAWEDVDWLYEQLVPLERQQRNVPEIGPSEQSRKEFFERELHL
jgi:hypothetical protein